MESFRLKLKVGPHEFEAEGDQQAVEQQLAIWRELIANPSTAAQPSPSQQPLASPPPGEPSGSGAEITQKPSNELSRTEADKLFRHEGRVVSLTVLPQNGGQRAADAALLLLLGQKIYNGSDLVTGQQIGDGLELSGLPIPRVDRGWGDHMEVNVVRVGSHRGVKYRLTNPGLTRATELARGLLAMVA